MEPVYTALSMSLDGFIAGPNDGPGNPLGDGGAPLLAWWSTGALPLDAAPRFRPPAPSRRVAARSLACGAVITGRRTFDIAAGWGGHHPTGAPFFVLTHRPIDRYVGPGTDGLLAPGGIRETLAAARDAAGGRPIAVGSADVVRQFLAADLLDEIHLTLVPVLLGGGRRLFGPAAGTPRTLTCVEVVPSDGVTHLRYRILRPPRAGRP